MLASLAFGLNCFSTNRKLGYKELDKKFGTFGPNGPYYLYRLSKDLWEPL